ncbi:hypothetical protein [Paenibacillus humicus]|uniref:hypothetical protein n=1 Tax=Paenibacillus humicus TaxID=412861 RepID=UPI00157FE36C|nr:hypothetical protein [Paenibacillus humicus]
MNSYYPYHAPAYPAAYQPAYQPVQAGGDCGCGGSQRSFQFVPAAPPAPGIFPPLSGYDPGIFPPIQRPDRGIFPPIGGGFPGGPGFPGGGFPGGPGFPGGGFPGGPGFPVPFTGAGAPGTGPAGTVNTPAPVTVRIEGGESFPYVTEDYQIPYYDGMSIAQALEYTGVVRISPGGGVQSVGGVRNDISDDIRIGDNVQYTLRLNGRQIPHTLLTFPVHRRDVIGIDLIHIGT